MERSDGPWFTRWICIRICAWDLRAVVCTTSYEPETRGALPASANWTANTNSAGITGRHLQKQKKVKVITYLPSRVPRRQTSTEAISLHGGCHVSDWNASLYLRRLLARCARFVVFRVLIHRPDVIPALARQNVLRG